MKSLYLEIVCLMWVWWIVISCEFILQIICCYSKSNATFVRGVTYLRSFTTFQKQFTTIKHMNFRFLKITFTSLWIWICFYSKKNILVINKWSRSSNLLRLLSQEKSLTWLCFLFNLNKSNTTEYDFESIFITKSYLCQNFFGF